MAFNSAVFCTVGFLDRYIYIYLYFSGRDWTHKRMLQTERKLNIYIIRNIAYSMADSVQPTNIRCIACNVLIPLAIRHLQHTHTHSCKTSSHKPNSRAMQVETRIWCIFIKDLISTCFRSCFVHGRSTRACMHLLETGRIQVDIGIFVCEIALVQNSARKAAASNKNTKFY